MILGGHDLARRVLVVAEIGNNHEGDFATAKELVRLAAEAGADAVKFQTYQTRLFANPNDPARYARLARFELSYPEFETLGEWARSLGLLFLSTPLDLPSARFLAGIVDAMKIASGDNDFYPLLEVACASNKPLIISSGLSDLGQIRAVKRFVEERWSDRKIDQDLAVLHCVSSYPVPPEEVNLASIPVLAEALGGTIGYSDHTMGIEACVASVALGARIIEKHFTMDHHFSDFRDHQLSADPAELTQLVRMVRNVDGMVGARAKIKSPCEVPAEILLRRSIVASSDLARGHRIDLTDLIWQRPGSGLRPGQESTLVGRRAKRAIAFGEQILPSDVE